MPDFTPIARSPIATQPTQRLRDGWEVSCAESNVALRIADCTPLSKLILRADPDGAAASALGVAHPVVDPR